MCISQKIADSPAGRRFLLLGKAPAGAPAERRAGGLRPPPRPPAAGPCGGPALCSSPARTKDLPAAKTCREAVFLFAEPARLYVSSSSTSAVRFTWPSFLGAAGAPPRFISLSALAITLAAISSASSGFCRRYSLALSRPCPSRISP